MKQIYLALIISCAVICSGCFKEDFSRYPFVPIPQYSLSDYYNLLSDKNPEIVYNAIVVLGQQAETLGEILSDEKVDKKSAEYTEAQNIYNKIVGQLNSSDTRVLVASLRFLQVFSNKYAMRIELVRPVLQIRNDNPQVLFEQVIILSGIANKDSNIPDPVVRKFMNNPSWIVSRGAYALVNALEHESLRHELINKYAVTEDEKEKLLLLSAFENQFSDAVAAFLFQEVLSTKSSKIRHAIFDMLGNSKNHELVLAWIDKNYVGLMAAEGEYLIERHRTAMTEKFSSRLLSIFLHKGFAVDDQFLEELNTCLEIYYAKKDIGDADKEKLSNLLAVESALITNKSLAVKWESLKNKSEAFHTRLTQFQTEYDVITKEYTLKLDDLFLRNNISAEKRLEYIDSILSSRNKLSELLAENKQPPNLTNDNK
ncbi:MAG: hypothetical protein WCI27_02480 [Candidatus Omnitrophota bacterium]